MAYRRLFVIVDPAQDEDPALARAARLLGDGGGHIHAYCAVYDSDLSQYESHQEGEREIRTRAKSKLETLLKPLASERLQVQTEAEWSHHPEDAAMRACSRVGADLLVKSALTNTGRAETHILRHSPAPVLLVRDTGSEPYRTALAAIALEDNDRKHDTLNNHVIAQARRLCNTTGAQLHAVSALEGAPNIGQILKILEDRDAEKLSGEEMIASSFGIDRKAVHIDYGPAKSVITETAEQIKADVLVIGTVARSRVSGTIIGNTCEKIMAATHIDVLTVS
jgi:universal stress protein E